MSQCFPCDFLQEGALDLLEKLNSCQMSIQLLQVGGRGLEVVALWEGKTPMERLLRVNSFPGSGVRVLGFRKKMFSLNFYPKPVRCKWL